MKKRVLFLCTGNAARSQMAEALARLDHGRVLDVVSAGSRPAYEVHSMAVEVMNELAGDYLLQEFDAVVTVCDHAAQDCPRWPGAVRIEHWSIEDPSFAPPPARRQSFRETRDELRQRISKLVEELTRGE